VNGMFAFALWDSQRQRLLIARDRLGVKPLYIWSDGRRLAFASEAKALFAVPGIRAELDLSSVRSYLTLGYVPSPQSMFRGVRKLCAATLLTVENNRVNERRYWRPPEQVDPLRSEEQWVGDVRTQLARSVSSQMVSDVPIGAFLSGGIDSSAVVAFMSAQPRGAHGKFSLLKF